MTNLLIGFILSLIIAYIAYKKKSLSLDGFVMAVIIGTMIYFFGGYLVWICLMMFFISSSLVTKIKEKEKNKAEINAKSGNRDYLQVLANGFLTLVFAIIFYYNDNENFLLLAIINIAVANADTWSSELGILSKGKTVSIISLEEVKKGTSGGVSLLGTVVSLFGAFFIAVVFVLLAEVTNILAFSFINIIIITFTGFVGSIIDSLLGASIQAQYQCLVCGKTTEKTVHHKRPTKLIGGFRFVTNDLVNFLSAFITTLIVYLIIIF